MEALTVTLMTAGLAVIIAVLGIVFSFLRAKNKELAARTSNTKFFNIVSVVTDTVDDVLEGMHDTLVAELKEKTADGNLTEEEVVEIVNNVKEKVGEILSENLKLDFIKDFVDDWDGWLEAKVRAAINRYLRNTKTPEAL